MSAPTPDTPTSGGAGRGGGRARNRRGKGNASGPAPAASLGSPPVNANKDIGEFYFELHNERPSRPQFQKTKDAIKSWVTKLVDYPRDLDPYFGDEMSAVALVPPVQPEMDKNGQVNPFELHKWKAAQTKFDRHADALETSLSILHGGIWAQCSDAMQSKVRAQPGFADAERKTDCFWFFQTIKAITHQFDNTRFPIVSLLTSRIKLLTHKQKPEDSLDVFADNLRAWAEVVEAYGGQVAETPLLKPGEKPPSAQAARERTLGTLMIMNADPARYSQVQNDLANSFVLEKDLYPTDLAGAYFLLTNYKPPPLPRA